MSLSNTATSGMGGPELRGGNITLDTILGQTTIPRQTKIVCTLGPACWSTEGLGALIDAGLSVARLNFSHGDHETHAATLERLRTVATAKQKHVGEFIWSICVCVFLCTCPYIYISPL